MVEQVGFSGKEANHYPADLFGDIVIAVAKIEQHIQKTRHEILFGNCVGKLASNRFVILIQISAEKGESAY